MSEERSEGIRREQEEIPAVLHELLEVLPVIEEEQLESQLQTWDSFLAMLSPLARPTIAGMLRVAARAAAEPGRAARILKAAEDVAAGGLAAAPYDHAAAMRAYREAHRQNFSGPESTSPDDLRFLGMIDEALAQIAPMLAAGLEPARSIARQLEWCRALGRDEDREPMPGPFSMGVIATREFDHYGDQPELASLINAIERLANARLAAAAPQSGER